MRLVSLSPCTTCIARGTSWQESLLSNKCNILPLVTKLSPQFPPFLSAVAQSAHLSRGEVNLSFQQERAHKCCATSVIQFGHSTGLYSNIYLLVVLFCVSGSSTWGSPIQGISRCWILPFRMNCIWSLSVAKSFMITWWIKFNYWPSGYKKHSSARHFTVCVGSGFNYGWSTVARVIVSEAGKWGTRVARRRYGPRHCFLSWSSRLSIW